jgi:hypothetical protein
VTKKDREVMQINQEAQIQKQREEEAEELENRLKEEKKEWTKNLVAEAIL